MSYAAAEQIVLESLGGFCKALYPSYSLFLLDEDFPRIEGPYFGMQIRELNKTGESDLSGYDGSSQRLHTVGYSVEVELIAFRGDSTEKPMGMLHKVQQLIEDDELRYLYFVKNNVGFVSTSPVTRLDTFLDSTTKELRARTRLSFNIQVQDSSSIASTPIETINYSVSVDEATPDTGTVSYP